MGRLVLVSTKQFKCLHVLLPCLLPTQMNLPEQQLPLIDVHNGSMSNYVCMAHHVYCHMILRN